MRLLKQVESQNRKTLKQVQQEKKEESIALRFLSKNEDVEAIHEKSAVAIAFFKFSSLLWIDDRVKGICDVLAIFVLACQAPSQRYPSKDVPNNEEQEARRDPNDKVHTPAVTLILILMVSFHHPQKSLTCHKIEPQSEE